MSLSTVKAGDTVSWENGEKVVVDLVEDAELTGAVLRNKDDMELEHPEYCEDVSTLTVTGHLHEIEGWKETAPGEWEKA